ncbi:MAG: MTAP family purine nucleoside phosphorylase [Planctomycetota bacterium]|jgi:5'-methylthioadenosine phosphorylase
MSDDIRIGIIGGTGLGDALQQQMEPAGRQEHVIDTPFGAPSGPVVTGTFADAPVALLQRHGAGHVYNPSHVPYRANVHALKSLGCTHLIASGATGSLREAIRPGDVVICDQLLDRTSARPRTFFEHAAVHVEFADPMCPVMRDWLNGVSGAVEGAVHPTGTYVCIEGPSFSTRVESEMHRELGADLVGMTALPEARLAREAEMAYALVALPTDYDCWRPHTGDKGAESLLQEIIGNLQRSSAASVALIRAALADVTPLRERRSPAHDALALAIWSDKTKISPDEVRRLEVLWGKYFKESH